MFFQIPFKGLYVAIHRVFISGVICSSVFMGRKAPEIGELFLFLIRSFNAKTYMGAVYPYGLSILPLQFWYHLILF